MLSRPADQFPDIFGNPFFKEYPYFLACAVPALFAAFAWLVVFFFLEDTIKNPTPITTLFWFRNDKISHRSLASDELPVPLRSVLTSHRVITAAANYAFLALCEISFSTLLPVFLSTPPAFGGPGFPPATIGMLLTITGILNAVFRVTFMAKILRVFGPRKTYLAGLVFTFLGFATFPVLSMAARREFDTLVWALALVQAIIPVGMSLSYGT
jgi:nitrate reductase NapE component